MDPTSLIGIAGQYGLTGLVLLACGYFIIYRDRANTKVVAAVADGHENERKEWRAIIDRQHQECIDARKDATEAVIGNTAVLAKLSTLIEDRK